MLCLEIALKSCYRLFIWVITWNLIKVSSSPKLGLFTTLLYTVSLDYDLILKIFQFMNPSCHTTAETTRNNQSKTSQQDQHLKCDCLQNHLVVLLTLILIKVPSVILLLEPLIKHGVLEKWLSYVLPQKIWYRVFMDNFFTSLRLLKFLASNNVRTSGTVRENQLGNCTITK